MPGRRSGTSPGSERDQRHVAIRIGRSGGFCRRQRPWSTAHDTPYTITAMIILPDIRLRSAADDSPIRKRRACDARSPTRRLADDWVSRGEVAGSSTGVEIWPSARGRRLSRAANGQQTSETSSRSHAGSRRAGGLNTAGTEGYRAGRRPSSRLRKWPVTPEVAGSSPVAPVKSLQISIFLLSALGANDRRLPFVPRSSRTGITAETRAYPVVPATSSTGQQSRRSC